MSSRTPTTKMKADAAQVELMDLITRAISAELKTKKPTVADLLEYWRGNAMGWKAWKDEAEASVGPLKEEVEQLRKQNAKYRNAYFDQLNKLESQISRLREHDLPDMDFSDEEDDRWHA